MAVNIPDFVIKCSRKPAFVNNGKQRVARYDDLAGITFENGLTLITNLARLKNIISLLTDDVAVRAIVNGLQ